jgi:8-oxo-dGTP diphosphatase
MPRPETPLLATDCVVLDGAGRVLLIRRKNEPYRGALALPGGFVEIGESVEAACRRELREETGLKADNLELVGVYSDPARDPRGHVCSVTFLARIGGATAVAGDDAAAVEWVRDPGEHQLAFDHALILRDALNLVEGEDQAADGPAPTSPRSRKTD